MLFWIDIWIFLFTIACLALVCVFEFINGFHDTANAVAPVIYTKSLKAKKAVLLAGFMNFLWVVFGWIWVAMAIIHILPLDAIGNQSTTFGIIVVVSLLLSAIIWNFSTWYFWIPASSSHSLIWGILWVTITMTFLPMSWDIEVIPNWKKAIEVMESLLISPLIWFALAGWLMYLSYKFIKSKYYFSTPWKGKHRPKLWLRSILIWTSAWVSFAHGSNDGQKWVGLAVLILVILVPWLFAINPKVEISTLNKNIISIENSINTLNTSSLSEENRGVIEKTKKNLLKIKESIKTWEVVDNVALRKDILAFQKNMKSVKAIISPEKNISPKVHATSSSIDSPSMNELNSDVEKVSEIIDYAPLWVILLISISLWLWTMVWRKRIVVTIGEKIGKTDLNYAQATTSAIITALTITLASRFHLPVSTTHILSSSIAGTMSTGPDAGWVKKSTVRHILMAWILTLPITIILSSLIFMVLWFFLIK